MPSPVKQLAIENGIDVFQPLNLKHSDQHQELADLKPDLMIVVAYGLILPEAVLSIPRLGCINVHASLLPRWRGAAPIERALLAGDTETGVTIMQMDKGLDTGDMLLKAYVDIGPDMDRQVLEDQLADAGAAALIHALSNLESILAHAQKQDDSLSTYAQKLDKNEALIQWGLSAEFINRTIRCGIGRTPAFSHLGDERVRIIKASFEGEHSHQVGGTIVSADKSGIRVACNNSTLNITALQMPGKNVVTAAEALNARGSLFSPGNRFSDEPSQ